MLSMKINKAMATMVEAMLPRFSDVNIGLMITLDLRDDDYGDIANINKSACTHFHIIFHRPSNYTKVLANYKFNNGLGDKDPQRNKIYFKKYSDHDSCWRSDGFTFLTRHWGNVEKFFGKHPKKLSNFYLFSNFYTPKYIEFETFEAVKEEDDYNTITGYNIKVKRTIPLNEIHNYLPKGS